MTYWSFQVFPSWVASSGAEQVASDAHPFLKLSLFTRVVFVADRDRAASSSHRDHQILRRHDAIATAAAWLNTEYGRTNATAICGRDSLSVL